MQKLTDQGYEVTVFMCSQESLKRAYLRYADLSYAKESKAGVFELSSEEVEEFSGKVKSLPDIAALINEAAELKHTYRITRILEIILAGALRPAPLMCTSSPKRPMCACATVSTAF